MGNRTVAEMDHRTIPHGGWNYRDPKTGWKPPRFLPFGDTVREIIAYRNKHPELQRSTDYHDVCEELESINGITFEPKLTEVMEKRVVEMKRELAMPPDQHKGPLKSDHDNSKLMVVLPFCKRDYGTMLLNLRWMVEMGQQKEYPALVVFDAGSLGQSRAIIEQAGLVFSTVDKYQYPVPPIEKWPEAANWSWQKTALYIQEHYKHPWLWLEADAIPLKPHWLQVLHVTYRNSGKRFMGSVVAHMGHVNGTAIYPYDAATRCPSAMKSVSSAWDADMRHEMIHDCYDASLLMQHAWGFHAGRLHPFMGSAASFKSPEDAKQILNSAVMFHRCKDGSLITQLRIAKRRLEQHARQRKHRR